MRWFVLMYVEELELCSSVSALIATCLTFWTSKASSRLWQDGTSSWIFCVIAVIEPNSPCNANPTGHSYQCSLGSSSCWFFDYMCLWAFLHFCWETFFSTNELPTEVILVLTYFPCIVWVFVFLWVTLFLPCFQRVLVLGIKQPIYLHSQCDSIFFWLHFLILSSFLISLLLLPLKQYCYFLSFVYCFFLCFHVLIDSIWNN